MFQLQLVGPEHEAAILAFERDNRAYFAKSISDRGDAFFEQFSVRHRHLVAEQEAGTGAFYPRVRSLARPSSQRVQDGTSLGRRTSVLAQGSSPRIDRSPSSSSASTTSR